MAKEQYYLEEVCHQSVWSKYYQLRRYILALTPAGTIIISILSIIIIIIIILIKASTPACPAH